MPDVMNFGTFLGFTPAWFTLGIVNQEFLDRAKAEWDKGEDLHREHYRYWAFQEFFAARRPLSPALAAALYDLGTNDEDQGMGGAIMAAIVYPPECPAAVLSAAAASGRRHLIRAVERRKA